MFSKHSWQILVLCLFVCLFVFVSLSVCLLFSLFFISRLILLSRWTKSYCMASHSSHQKKQPRVCSGSCSNNKCHSAIIHSQSFLKRRAKSRQRRQPWMTATADVWCYQPPTSTRTRHILLTHRYRSNFLERMILNQPNDACNELFIDA